MKTFLTILFLALLVNGVGYIALEAIDKETAIKEKRDAKIYGLTAERKAEIIKRIK